MDVESNISLTSLNFTKLALPDPAPTTPRGPCSVYELHVMADVGSFLYQ